MFLTTKLREDYSTTNNQNSSSFYNSTITFYLHFWILWAFYPLGTRFSKNNPGSLYSSFDPSGGSNLSQFLAQSWCLLDVCWTSEERNIVGLGCTPIDQHIPFFQALWWHHHSSETVVYSSLNISQESLLFKCTAAWYTQIRFTQCIIF